MMDRRLRRLVRPLARSARAAADRLDAVTVRRQAKRLLRGSQDWEIGPIHRARSGMRIARIRSARDGSEAILKITDAREGSLGLDRERGVLSRMAAEPRLETVRPLLPDVLEAGSDGGWSYLVQRSLPGVPATTQLTRERRGPLVEASGIVARLHGATAASRTVGEPEVAEWIARPASAVRGLVAQRPGSREGAALDRLTDELGAAVMGATVPLGWIHGDLWSDNILVDGRTGTVTGIVDWDSASDAGLAAHDQLHLVLYTRKMLQRTEIGTEICRALGPEPGWDAPEVAALSAGTDQLPGRDEDSRRRLGILLYWLRLASMNLVRQPDATRSRRWLDDNVRAVLACL